MANPSIWNPDEGFEEEKKQMDITTIQETKIEKLSGAAGIVDVIVSDNWSSRDSRFIDVPWLEELYWHGGETS